MSLTAVALAMAMGNAPLAAPPTAPETPNPEVSIPAASAQPVTLPNLTAPTFVVATTPVLTLPSPQPTAAPDGTITVPVTLPAEATAPDQPAELNGADASADTPPQEYENEIIVGGTYTPPPGDPLEQLNAESFRITQAIDGAVIEPVAKAYNNVLPKPVRQGLRNFFSNLEEPIIAASFLLQLKPHSAVKTVARFAVNSTLGLAGIIDVAKRKPFNLPYQPNGIADVMGFYGVGPGPYFYIPIIGPTTLRDLAGDTVQIILQPITIGGVFTDPIVAGSTTVLDQLGERAAFDETINNIHKEDDPYATYRDLYLKQRKAEIDALRGRTTPDFVPVYGPDMPTADGKGDKSKVEAPAEVQPQDAKPTEPAPEPMPSAQETPEPVLQN